MDDIYIGTGTTCITSPATAIELVKFIVVKCGNLAAVLTNKLQCSSSSVYGPVGISSERTAALGLLC
jgi:hypothetical protein